MIRNERQAALAREQLERARETLNDLEGSDRDVQLEMLNDIQSELVEYERLQNGECRIFTLRDFDDIPDSLVKARIARGWTQRELAEELGVSEQMVQKDEAGAYERATLVRLVDVADALGYSLTGQLRPKERATPEVVTYPSSHFRIVMAEGSTVEIQNDVETASTSVPAGVGRS